MVKTFWLVRGTKVDGKTQKIFIYVVKRGNEFDLLFVLTFYFYFHFSFLLCYDLCFATVFPGLPYKPFKPYYLINLIGSN